MDNLNLKKALDEYIKATPIGNPKMQIILRSSFVAGFLSAQAQISEELHKDSGQIEEFVTELKEIQKILEEQKNGTG